MIQAPNRPTPPEQHFIYAGVTWEGFKVIQAALDSPGLRMSYFRGEIELLTVSDLHGLIAENLGYLLEMYMLAQGIRFIALGDFSIEVTGQATAQADTTYCFADRKAVPDLAIEVVITGESETKLKRYALLGVSEVWFGIEGKIGVHCLAGGQYTETQKSLWCRSAASALGHLRHHGSQSRRH